ncbi:hypothetical protein AB0E83_04650 [Streptomyces sp. NPDC035033]|uniref:hypothetical protein n=1 Tax=Streptomyces sp. NPDC035033 TaxID=3155368 RepID=UPI0033ED28E1
MRPAPGSAPRPAPAPGCGAYAAAPVLAAAGAYAGTAWTARAWADCPLGNDAGGTVGLLVTMVGVWLCMTLLLLLLPLVWRRRPLRGGRAARWLVPLAAAVALTLLYRAGMGWPHHPPGGPCVEGYPLFPFTGGTGP